MHKQMQKPNRARTNHKNARQAKSSPNGNGHNFALEPDDAEPDYFDDRALNGLPELAVEPPTALIKIHAVFTVQHVVTELRYQFELGNLTHSDREMIAQLGKEITEELTA